MCSIEDVLKAEAIDSEAIRQLFEQVRCEPRAVQIGSAFPERGHPLVGWLVANLGKRGRHEYYCAYCGTACETGEAWGILRGHSLVHCTECWFRTLQDLLDAWADDLRNILPSSTEDVRATRAEFDWYACDAEGYVALFSSGEEGFIPPCVFDEKADYELLAGYFSMVQGSLRVADSFWGQSGHFQKVADRRGVFAYAWSLAWKYEREGVPRHPIRIVDVCPSVRDALLHLRCSNVCFRKDADAIPQMKSCEGAV